MPKLGAEADTPDGRGNVVSVNMLKMTVKVKIDDRQGGLVYKDFPLAEVKFKKGNAQQGNKKEDDED
jgi:cell fate regulator YaaT (PSP1 superfamily)